jgi:hypothetical protein
MPELFLTSWSESLQTIALSFVLAAFARSAPRQAQRGPASCDCPGHLALAQKSILGLSYNVG